jgi:hypothetical protein
LVPTFAGPAEPFRRVHRDDAFGTVSTGGRHALNSATVADEAGI